jgi:hypothetical protein
MRALTTIAREIFGLFVDDGRFALSLLLWLAVVALLLPRLPIPPGWDGPVLFAGLAVILVGSCVARVRRGA